MKYEMATNLEDLQDSSPQLTQSIYYRSCKIRSASNFVSHFRMNNTYDRFLHF
jgi:hypothetical protein